MRLLPITWSLAFLASCGSMEEKMEPVAEQPTRPEIICNEEQMTYQLISDSIISWTTYKNGEPVNGWNQVKGSLILDHKGHLDKASMYLEFDEHPHSGIELRDDRIMGYVYRYGKVVFDLEETSGADTLKQEETIELKLRGMLGFPGVAHEADIPVEVTAYGGHSIRVKNQEETVKMSVTSMGIADRIQTIANIVGVTWSDEIEFKFDMILRNACSSLD